MSKDQWGASKVSIIISNISSVTVEIAGKSREGGNFSNLEDQYNGGGTGGGDRDQYGGSSSIGGRYRNLNPSTKNFLVTGDSPVKSYEYYSINEMHLQRHDLDQVVIKLKQSEKRAKLLDILKNSKEDDKVIVFCNNKKSTDFLAASLATSGILTTSLHGDRTKTQRETALREFAQGKWKVLVGTSLASKYCCSALRPCSRMIMPEVAIVVNFDLPNDIEEYARRTGSLGQTGRILHFYEESKDCGLVTSLVRFVKGARQALPDSSYDVPKVVEKHEEDWN